METRSNESPKLSPLRAWLSATRPRTLTAGISPVLLGCAIAWHDAVFIWIPALLCILVAVFAQIASNFANDYFDYKKGADGSQRLGPERAVAQGWIRPQAMLYATFFTLGLACLAGCGLIYFGGGHLLFIGIAIALAVLAYSTGPYPLSYHGWGDLCVFIFYGIIPVCYTYYVQAGRHSLLALLLSFSLGLLAINILMVNNYRDYEEDKRSGKRTTVVRFGKGFARFAYLFNDIAAIIITLPLLLNENTHKLFLVGFALFCGGFYVAWIKMGEWEGKQLNKLLGITAMLVFIYALLTSFLVISL